MVKRPSSPTQRSTAAPATRQPEAGDDVDMGAFEDMYEDEYEDEDVNDDEDGDEDGEMDQDDHQDAETKAYLPNLAPVPASDPSRPLVPDLSSYVFLHHANLTWPALSFALLRDSYGSYREKPPHEMSLVAGTQATRDEPGANQLVVMRWEGLSRVKREQNDEDSDNDDDDNDDEDDVDQDPTFTHRAIPHDAPINRISAQPLSERSITDPYHVATFSESGKVHIYDVSSHLAWLHDPTSVPNPSALPTRPIHTVTAHNNVDGFAIAWAPLLSTSSSTRRLLTGDMHSKIFLTELDPAGGAFTTSSTRPFTSHTSSVEDIAWSPSESSVFASVSADRSLRIWDTRTKDRKSVLAVQNAHEADINVLSWNNTTTYTMVTGGDEGNIRVWDLRHFQNSNNKNTSPKNPGELACFSWHKQPITSIEWNPNESSSFAVSCADDQVSLWELGVEADTEESSMSGNNLESKVPPQLLFVHQGQRDVKEVHWHPQIPGSVVTTSLDGFDIFKTISF